MSAQILLQGRLLGTEDFLLAAPADRDNRAFEARSMWLVLIGEAVPRALLAELQLPPLMLGSSGGNRFVVILPDQARAEAAGQFLTRVSQALSDIGSGKLSLVWSARARGRPPRNRDTSMLFLPPEPARILSHATCGMFPRSVGVSTSLR
jgi:hypothetical protein